MTKIKKIKTDYGYEKLACHLCETKCFVGDAEKTRGLTQHITIQARNEAFRMTLGDANKTPHLDYYLAHTKPRVVPGITKRDFDDDLEVA